MYRVADGVWLEDLGSTNGTYINGDRLTVPYRLLDGDEVKLGNSLATFHEVVNGPDVTQILTIPDPEPALAVPDRRSVEQAATPALGSAGVVATPAAAPVPAGGDGRAAGPHPPVVPTSVGWLASEVDAATPPAAVAEPAGVGQVAPDVGVGAGPEEAIGPACPQCSTSNRAEAYFCRQCGGQLRAIAFEAAGPVPAGVRTNPIRLTTGHGDVRRQEFRRAMRARNGGRRVPYNEALAVPTMVFRGFIVVLVLALAVFSLVILSEGVHRALGL
jgi:hypothetical protein